MITINQKMEHKTGKRIIKLLAITVLSIGTFCAALADAPHTIRLLEPLDGATVREMVPVKISPADLPNDGYVTVSVDNVFRTAKLIEPGNSLVYVWDTQAAYQDPNSPGTDQYSEDGNHEIEVAVYDRSGSKIATGTSEVKLANKVTNLPDGITLSYNWSEDETMRYKRHSELNILSNGTTAPSSGQSADIRFSRSVEDVNSGEYLVRDMVYDDGLITMGGTVSPVQSLFNLKSRYRTVNKFGDVLVEETPFSVGDHLGFPIPEVPARRITAGDSWECKIEAAVTWANEKPTELAGNARLDSFEWQDGYPTAKVIETYDGPAQFYADVRGTVQFQADNIHLVRTYWFAYNSKRLVRVKTDMTIDGTIGPDILSAFGTAGASSGMPQPQQFQPPVANPFGGDNGDNPQPDNGPMVGPQGAATTTPVKLEVIDDTTLVGI